MSLQGVLKAGVIATDVKLVVASELDCGEVIWAPNPTENLILADCSLRSISFTLFKLLLIWN